MIVWLIGMSAAGKTVVAKELYKLIKQKHKDTILIDGDIFRGLLNNDVKHTIADRKKNSDRICRMCKLLDDQDINVICAILSIFHEAQQWNRENYKKYCEVYLDVSFETLKKRDPKQLYKKALNKEIQNVVGVDIEFKPPINPDLVIKNEGDETPSAIAQQIFEKLNL